MPNWFIISAADLNDHKVAALVDALRQEALAAGQTDPLPRIVAEVTNEIRGAIAFSGRYLLDADAAALPNSLKEIAVKKAVRVLKGRLQQPLDKDEERDAEVYEARLKALVRGEWPVDEPDTPLAPVPVQSAASSPRISSRRREFTRECQEGV
ncbi:MAG: hypothetical protein HZC55_26590 [Verrucomicrobia bacterium]|nr:hypothetical protein [Verrucomicrobiota bacterium]